MDPYQHVYQTVSALGIPGALQAFPEPDAGGAGAPPLPFFTYDLVDPGTVRADDGDWCGLPTFEVELYEASRDRDLEDRVAEALRSEFGPVSRDEAWVAEEHCRMVAWTFTVAGDEMI